MTETALPDSVVIQVVDLKNGRAIGWDQGIVEKLQDRIGDVRAAIRAGAQAVAMEADELPSRKDWQVSELAVSFGITLAAEAGVVLSKASAEATFEVTVTFQRK